MCKQNEAASCPHVPGVRPDDADSLQITRPPPGRARRTPAAARPPPGTPPGRRIQAEQGQLGDHKSRNPPSPGRYYIRVFTASESPYYIRVLTTSESLLHPSLLTAFEPLLHPSLYCIRVLSLHHLELRHLHRRRLPAQRQPLRCRLGEPARAPRAPAAPARHGRAGPAPERAPPRAPPRRRRGIAGGGSGRV